MAEDVVILEGRVELEVVGESHYQENLGGILGTSAESVRAVHLEVTATLRPDTDNAFDSNAISVWVEGLQVGYLSRTSAARLRPGLVALQKRHGRAIALRGVIAGGGLREDGPGFFGLFMRFDPLAFGVESEPEQPRAAPDATTRLRTGLSDALATDASDNAYDLSWMRDLPQEPGEAVARLRQLLDTEPDSLGRHFLYVQMERILYKARSSRGSALTEFDEICRNHDAEMDTMRSAFMAKWGAVPWLNTYRQMSIRLQKQGDYASALWWAERGLAVYGTDAARADALEDLMRRAALCRAKLASNVPEVRKSATED